MQMSTMRSVSAIAAGAIAIALTAGAAVATSTTEPTPLGDEDNAHVFVIGKVAVPAGTAGEVEIVLEGSASGSSVPLIVRNNTDAVVYSVEVEGIARGADGALIGSGSSFNFAPSTLAPGQWAIGEVYFGYDVLTEGATFMFQVHAETEPGWREYLQLTVGEATINRGDWSLRAVGLVLNETDTNTSSSGDVTIACFADDGALVAVQTTYTEASTVRAGGFSSFSTDLYDVEDCSNAAFVALGYPES